MALADSVPGVSGGTIAFLLGFYDKFIGSLDDIISGTKEEKKEAVKFLIKIGIGWVIGFCMAILFITTVFEDNIYEISSLFIGFILFAIPIIVREEKDCLKGKYLNMIFIVLGGALVAGITYFSGSTILADGVNLSAGKFGFGVGILLFIAGMVAISAMVLPGISGSTILMVFGLYIPVTTAIKDILHLKFEYIPAVAIFGVGIIIGILMVVKLIKKLLDSFRSQTVYFIIGMMIGSFYSIAMGPTTLKSSEGVNKGLKMLTWDSFSIWFFLIGGVIILGLQYLKYIMEKKSQVQK
ncbi:MAG: DUF368 domain-containing protein [Lachnospiraceae bacterium]|nr:DUF368 domain-containing protein [Lachnospiraceae bacterium]